MFGSPGDRSGRSRTSSLIGRHIFGANEPLWVFSNILQIYSDIELTAVGRTSAAAPSDSLVVRVNGLSTGIYDMQRQYANNVSPGADQILLGTSFFNGGGFNLAGNTARAGEAGYLRMRFSEYTDPIFWKQGEFYNRAPISTTTASAYVIHGVFQVEMKDPVTSISISSVTGGAVFMPGTKVTLRGIM